VAESCWHVIFGLRLTLRPCQHHNPNLMKPSAKNSTPVKPQRPVRAAGSRLSVFARRLLAAWRTLQLPSADAPIIVAVSGGADSTGLLLAIDELIVAGHLNLEMVVAHLDHGLRPEAKDDAKWVANLAGELGHGLATRRSNVRKRADDTSDNLEQAARRARYEFLAGTAAKHKAEMILTAHTMDDQAETVLLRLLRGSGADGLTGIDPVRRLDSRTDLLLARPLLNWARRSDTENYCRQRKVEFRIDSMNEDLQFARVRVRKQLIPLMESFNGKIVDALARSAELLRDDLVVLNQAAEAFLMQASANEPGIKTETNVPRLSVSVLAKAPAALRRRALRQWLLQARGDLRRFELVHMLGIERLLVGDVGGRIAELPGGSVVRRKRGWLEMEVKKG
jgi:tRNA(Ile)-lysidine synthase